MCKFWKKICQNERKNHHFPELVNRNDLKNLFLKFTCHKYGLILVLILNLLAGGFYLVQTNITATYGFRIRSLETELASLEMKNKQLGLDYIKLQSMDRITEAVKNFNLVPVNNLETLIFSTDKTIALNRN